MLFKLLSTQGTLQLKTEEQNWTSSFAKMDINHFAAYIHKVFSMDVDQGSDKKLDL